MSCSVSWPYFFEFSPSAICSSHWLISHPAGLGREHWRWWKGAGRALKRRDMTFFRSGSASTASAVSCPVYLSTFSVSRVDRVAGISFLFVSFIRSHGLFQAPPSRPRPSRRRLSFPASDRLSCHTKIKKTAMFILSSSSSLIRGGRPEPANRSPNAAGSGSSTKRRLRSAGAK